MTDRAADIGVGLDALFVELLAVGADAEDLIADTHVDVFFGLRGGGVVVAFRGDGERAGASRAEDERGSGE